MPRALTLRVVDLAPVTPRAVLLRLDLEGIAFHFQAGQAVVIGRRGRGHRKPYSIACSPEQTLASGRLELLVGRTPRGGLGAHLSGIRPGSAVQVEGPLGTFVLAGRIRSRRVLFVAGGTGIAPLRAMIWTVLTREDPPEIALLYSARTPAEFAYGAEFRRLARQRRITLRQTATRGSGRRWHGHRGRIDQAMLTGLIVEPRFTTCFVCGPDSLVADVPVMLQAVGVPLSRVHYEEY